MKVIWKYELQIGETGLYSLVLPKGSIVRYVGCQGTGIFIWVEVDHDYLKQLTAQLEVRTFHTVGTGWVEINPGSTYLGSAQHGMYVWHVYEVTHLQNT